MMAFIYPGQGSQRVGMGRKLAEDFPLYRETLDEANHALGESLSRLCFEGPEDRLLLTENTQPAILATSVATHRVLESRGIVPDYVAGHSLGEYSAHVAAGTISFVDALGIVRRRGRYMQEAVPVGQGAMAAILGLAAETVARLCEEEANGETVSPANINTPIQIVIAGTQAAVERVAVRARAVGARRVVSLAVSAPFHCGLMRPAQQRLEPELRALQTSTPRIPVIANVDAEAKHDPASAIEALVSQVTAPVQWDGVVRRLKSLGVSVYVEVGPGAVLSGLVRKIDRTSTVVQTEGEGWLDTVEQVWQKSRGEPDV